MTFPFNVIDLTHIISPATPSWEGDCGFQHRVILDYSDCTTPIQFKVQKINMYAGLGTHIDAPAHCIPDGKTVDKLELDELIAPCIVIDTSKQAHEFWQLSPDDIRQFERKHGQIGAGAFVIIRTGWDQYWGEPEKYRNNMQFPSISCGATDLLLERNIAGLGIDTLSPDTPDSNYPVHAGILSAGKYLVENVANSSKMPPKGSFSLALPIHIEDGTEAPIRLIGLINTSIAGKAMR